MQVEQVFCEERLLAVPPLSGREGLGVSKESGKSKIRNRK